MPKLVNPLFFEYQLKCMSCGGTQRIEQATTAGWTLGFVIPYDAIHPDVARCIRCKRHMMKVTNEPPPPPIVEPEGWTKVPTK